MPICRLVSCVVRRRCLLWPVRFHDKTRLPFALLHFVLQGQLAYFPGISCLPSFVFQSPMMKRTFFFNFLVLVLESLVGLHRTIQLQLLQHYWSGHRHGLPWYRMVSLGNEPRSICRFWGCTQALHFRLFCWLWGATPFLLRDSCP